MFDFFVSIYESVRKLKNRKSKIIPMTKTNMSNINYFPKLTTIVFNVSKILLDTIIIFVSACIQKL
jgi:hypothetical protein